jgi:hypothetical protein
MSGIGHTSGKETGTVRLAGGGPPVEGDIMERKFQLLPEIVQVSLEHGETPADIVPVLSDAARIARAREFKALLVVSGFGDPATAEAVSAAIDEIHSLGAPAFKIAFVAYTFPQYSVYHFAERYAQRFGIIAKVLVSVRDAKDWLGLSEDLQGARGFARSGVVPRLMSAAGQSLAPITGKRNE